MFERFIPGFGKVIPAQNGVKEAYKPVGIRTFLPKGVKQWLTHRMDLSTRASNGSGLPTGFTWVLSIIGPKCHRVTPFDTLIHTVNTVPYPCSWPPNPAHS